MRAMQQADARVVAAVFDRAKAWRDRSSGLELEALDAGCRGVAALSAGDWRATESLLAASEQLYRERCPGSVWELSNVRGSLLNASFWRGQLRKHAEDAQRWLEEATLRGDRFALAAYGVMGFGSLRHLLPDNPQRALAEISDLMAPWRGESVGIQHFMEAIASATVHCYEGGQGAEAYWAECWPRLERSFLFRMPFMQETLVAERIGTVLARAGAGTSEAELLREARRLTPTLRRARSVIGIGWAAFYGAQLDWLEGEHSKVAGSARRLSEQFERAGWVLAPYADLLAARAEGAPDMADRERRILDWLGSEGFANPEKALYWFLPVARTWR